MVDLPFNMFVMFVALSTTLGIVGIILGMRKIAGAPFITIFAGILMFGVFATTQTIDVGYSDAQPSNTTQTGGNNVCTTSATNTTCTTTSILKSFSYFNSTGQLTNKPDPIPQQYQSNQQNMWVFTILLSVFWIMLGIFIQWQKW